MWLFFLQQLPGNCNNFPTVESWLTAAAQYEDDASVFLGCIECMTWTIAIDDL